MRSAITLLLAIALPAVAAAQSTARHGAPFSALGPIGLPLPSISTTLPPIGSRLPRFEQPKIDSSFKIRGLTPARKPQRPDHNGPGRPDRRGHDWRRDMFPAVVYVVPSIYPDFYSPEPGVVAPLSPQPLPALQLPPDRVPSGWLRLELENAAPGTQLFVDGYFVGTFEDVNGQLLLEAGTHDVDIRSNGSKPIVFGVRMIADRTITYRGAFENLSGVTASKPPSPPASSVIYFIPGCYVGNVAPQPAALRAGCDIGKLSTYKP